MLDAVRPRQQVEIDGPRWSGAIGIIAADVAALLLSDASSSLPAEPPSPPATSRRGPTHFNPAPPPTRSRRGRRCGARAGRGARRVVRGHSHQPLPPRIDCHARAAGAKRLALDELRLRRPRAGERRVGLRRHRTSSSPARRARRPNRPSPSLRRTRCWRRARSCSPTPTRSSTTWKQRVQAGSVRGPARNQDRVPAEAQ